jgi:hypothetical protein
VAPEPATSAPAVTAQIGVTIVATQSARPSPTAVPVEEASASPEATAAATSVATALSACSAQVNPSPAAPAKPATLTDTLPALTTFLNAGASPSATYSLLQSWGYIYVPSNAPTPVGSVQQARVLPGADTQIIVTYYDPVDQQTPTRHGNLVVFGCNAGAVQVLYAASADPEFAGTVTNPRVLSTQDVSGDGVGDLSFVVEDCGASTCFDGVYILAAQNGTLTNLIPDFEWSPFPSFSFVASTAKPGTQDLQVQRGYVGTPGAGPQRGMTDTWSYTGSVYTLTQRVKEPPTYRIHALQDADEAFRRKDLATANALYQRVANDPSLQSWDGNTPLRDEAQVLAAFAYVRLIQSAAFAGDAATLKAAHDALTMAASPKSAGAIYASLGEAFWDAFNLSKNYALACDAVAKYADKNQNTFLILGQETFGFANQDYGADDMCIAP